MLSGCIENGIKIQVEKLQFFLNMKKYGGGQGRLAQSWKRPLTNPVIQGWLSL